MGTNEEQYAEWAKTQKILEDRAAAAALAAPGVPPRGGPVLEREPVDVHSLPDAPSMYGGGAIGQPQAVPKKTLMQKAIDVGTELGGGSTNTEDIADPAVLARRKEGVSEAEQTNSEDVANPTKLAQRNEAAGVTTPGQEPVAEEEGTPAPSPGVFIPGGMRPNTEERVVHYAKGTAPGVREAYGAGMGLQLEAAKIERDAGAQYYDQQKHLAELKLNANQSAMQQQQRLTEDRDREVNKRLADIETLNTQARGKPEDIWSNPVIFGRLVGALLFGLGGAAMVANKGRNVGTGMGLMLSGQFVTGLINQDINAKLDERKQAGNQAKAQTDLLHLHLDRMDSEKKAIEATKLAYYDSVLQQMEIVNAESQGQINEAKYKNLQDQILEAKAKTSQGLYVDEQNDIHDKQINKYAPPQRLDGTGATGLKDVPNTVTLSDRTSWELGDSPGAQKARERIVAMQKLQNVNDRIKSLRKQAYKLDPLGDKTEYGAIYGQLEDLGGQKAPLMSMALDGSTIRKDERDEIEKHNIKAVEGLGVPGVPYSNKIPVWSKAQQVTADAVLDQQQSLWHDAQRTEAAGSGGREVVRGYVHDEHGNKTPVAKYTGRNAAPAEHLAPPGFVSDDPTQKTATQGPGLAARTPKAPDFGLQVKPPPAAGKKKKEK